MNYSPDKNLFMEGVNPADLLNPGILTESCGGELSHLFHAPSIDDLVPLFPALEIIELIGEGGMGAVYKARQRDLDRMIALKILPEEIGGDPTFSEQFTREAKALAKLNHTNIVSIYEFGEREGLYYIVMEYVDGTNLRNIMERGLVNPQDALVVVPQICDALQYAHDRGIVHRDIKPENILINREGIVKVVDFGLVKWMEGQQAMVAGKSLGQGNTSETLLSRDGRVMGTPAYMAPEQLEAPANVDNRADIYALGVVFYQMLTGALPSSAIPASSRKMLKDSRLDGIVLKAMEKNPEKRYQQVSLMKTGLETVSSEKSPSSLTFGFLVIGGLVGASLGVTWGLMFTLSHFWIIFLLFVAGIFLMISAWRIRSHEELAFSFFRQASYSRLIIGGLLGAALGAVLEPMLSLSSLWTISVLFLAGTGFLLAPLLIKKYNHPSS